MVLSLESMWSWQESWDFAMPFCQTSQLGGYLFVYMGTSYICVCVYKFCLVLLNYYLGQSLRAMNFTGCLFTRNKIMFPFP